MNQQPVDLRDDVLGARLKSALGTMPFQLASRLVQLSAAGLRRDRPEPRRPRFWLELIQRSAGMALLVALPAALLPRFLALVMRQPTLLVRWVPAPPAIDSPVAAMSLLLPIAILLLVEALRGAPTIWRWVR